MSSSTPDIEADKRELRELALRYARACDTHDAAEFEAIFTEDGVIESPGHTMRSRAEIVKIVPTALRDMYIKTMHLVHNNLVWVDGNTATGETYCLAHHLTKQADGRIADYIMAITYTNRYRKVDGTWRFEHRRLNLNWSQTTYVDLPAG